MKFLINLIALFYIGATFVYFIFLNVTIFICSTIFSLLKVRIPPLGGDGDEGGVEEYRGDPHSPLPTP